MKKNGLDKLYDRLTPQQRFRLVIEAKARGDEEDVERLLDRCPLVGYVTIDTRCTDRIRASSEVTTVAWMVLAPRLAKLQILEIFQNALPYVFNLCINEAAFAYLAGHEAGARRAWEAADKTGGPPGWEEEKDEGPAMEEELRDLQNRICLFSEVRRSLLDNVEELERRITRDALAIWKAFANFCYSEVGVEPEKLMRVWVEPVVPQLEKIKNLPDPPEIAPEKLSEYERAFKQTWHESTRPV